MTAFWSNLCDIFLKYTLLQAFCCGFLGVAYISHRRNTTCKHAGEEEDEEEARRPLIPPQIKKRQSIFQEEV